MNTTEHGHRGAAAAVSPASRAEPIGGPNPAGRDSPAGSLLLALATSLLLTGCAAPTLLVEAEHVSHPTTGEHHEVGLSQANALLRWRHNGWYMDAGLGVNLQGRDGGGFIGSPLTGTVRIGREFVLVAP